MEPPIPTLDPTKYSFANPLHVYDPDDPPTSDRTTLEPSEFLCAGEHPAREVEWLWPDRIPLGKVSLLIGNPGLGKSLLTIDMAARVTRGLPFPEFNQPAAESRQGDTEKGRQGDLSMSPSSPVSPSSSLSPRLPFSLSSHPTDSVAEPPHSTPGSVIILSASDDLTDTIRPRLDAAGADANRVFVLPKIRDLRTDFAKLRAAVEAAPNCRLVIVDPVNAYVGPSDSHFHTVVRRVLEPLAELAAEKNLAILAVTHLRKNDGAAIQRAAGSMGFVSMARTIWTVAEDPQDPARRLFLPLKNNLGPDVGGFSFRIVSSSPFASSAMSNNAHSADEMKNDETQIPNDSGLGIRHSRIRHSSSPLIVWDDAPITGSSRDAITPPKPPRRPTERDAAREFLRHTLADGPRPASELFAEAKEQGFTPRTLQRAFHELDGHTTKEGFRAGCFASLHQHGTLPSSDRPKAPVAFAQRVAFAKSTAFNRFASVQPRVAFSRPVVFGEVVAFQSGHRSPPSEIIPSVAHRRRPRSRPQPLPRNDLSAQTSPSRRSLATFAPTPRKRYNQQAPRAVSAVGHDGFPGARSN